MTEGRARPRARAISTAIIRCAGATLVALLATQAPALAGEPAPNLDQSIAADQPLAADPAVLAAGHVDIGPRYVDNRWTLLIHDGTGQPVWRSPDRTVLRVSDAAIQTVPDDPAYAFLGVAPGKRVHVVPQTQNPDVVWVGWNTQDPRVMQTIDRGVTLSLLGVRGPGTLTTYLQSGNFAAPQVLWRPAESAAQPFWAEVNTHTHANWVFTEPGVYLVTVRVSANLFTGEEVSATGTLRFAVGNATSTDEALTARTDIAPALGGHTPADRERVAGGESDNSSRTPLFTVLAGAAVLLATGLVLVLARGGGAKRRAERERTATTSGSRQ